MQNCLPELLWEKRLQMLLNYYLLMHMFLIPLSTLVSVDNVDNWILNEAVEFFRLNKDLSTLNTNLWNFTCIIILENSWNGLTSIINTWE